MKDNGKMSEQAIKDKDYTLAIIKLKTFGSFSQRENYELWDNNPKNVKYKDLEEVARDIKFLKDFINQQQAELESIRLSLGLINKRKYYRKFVDEVFRKQKGKELSTPDFDYIYELYFKQQAEIEDLKIINEHLATFNIENEAEIERLKNMVAQNEGVLPEYENLIKAEAIKEFAERFEEEFFIGDITHSITKEEFEDFCKRNGG